MRRRPVRTCLSILLVFTLLSMLPLEGAMALSMDIAMGMPVSMEMSGAMADAAHGTAVAVHSGHQTAALVALHRHVNDTHHRAPCPCDGHCGLCGACFSVLPSTSTLTFAAAGYSSAELRLSNLTDISFSPDPRPPRV